MHAAEASVVLVPTPVLNTHVSQFDPAILRPPTCPALQHMGVELDEQNRRVDAVGARAENTHDEIR